MATATVPSTVTPTPAPASIVRQNPSPQVLIWAAIGLLAVVVAVVGWTGWILSPDFKPTPPGPDPISDAKMVGLYVIQGVSVLLAALFLWRVLLQPAIKRRELTFDGMFLLGSLVFWFTDPAQTGYFNFTFAYNAHMVNFGSWARYIPGFETPNFERLAEPLLMVGGAYVWWIVGGTILGCAVLRKIQQRWPNISSLGMFAILWLAILPLDILFENLLFVRTEAYGFPGVIRDFSLWPGTRYQFPLYEAPLMATFLCLLVAVRWFRDDRGRSVIERGVESVRFLRGSRKRQKVASLLAVTGAIHVVITVTYIIPWNWLAVKTDTFPPFPSYMLNQICGNDSEYACPSRVVPVPKRGSLHIRPDDPRLPEEVREGQGFRR